MDAELKQLASAARAAGGYISGGKKLHPPSIDKKKKKKIKKKQEKTYTKEKDSKEFSNSSAAPSWNSTSSSSTLAQSVTASRPRRTSFDASSSSYGRLKIQKPPPAAVRTKFTGKKITFGEAEKTTDKYNDVEDNISSNKNIGTGNINTKDDTLNGRLGLEEGSAPRWYENTPASLVDGATKAKLSFDAGKKMEREAEEMWKQEIAAYTTRKEDNNDGKWLRTVMRNGTLSDRVAAMSMVVQESVLHNFGTLTALVGMTKKRGSREAHLAIEAVRDLFSSYLLPSHRKLVMFHNHPLDHSNVTPKHLIWWKFESDLRETYSEFINHLQEGAQESLPYFKRACIQAVQELLSKKPEQEKRLLHILVNKLGDPNRKIGANVVFLLQQIIREHPGMKISIVNELSGLMFRERVAQRAQYYSLVFMTEIPLVRTTDQELAKTMIKLYIRMFTVIISETKFRDDENYVETLRKKKKKARWGENGPSRNAKKVGSFRDKRKKKNVSAHKTAVGDSKTKLIRALLQGINRAFPYAECEGSETSEMTDALFRIVHSAPFNTGVQALLLLLHVMTARNTLSDRFYRTLYQKLFDPDLRKTHKYTIFLNVVYKAMKIDDDGPRVLSYVKRLLQLCLSTTNASFTCGVLFLISEVGKHQEQLKDHLKNINISKAKTEAERYDATKRDPCHAHAETTPLWELSMLEEHYHPSVRSFATSLKSNESDNKIIYSGDPLLDFSTAAFLERFSYRNPSKFYVT
jgi:hypothetical protein